MIAIYRINYRLLFKTTSAGAKLDLLPALWFITLK